MSLFVFFISLLIVAQHVSGNHVPTIRSWRLRDVIASCWYVLYNMWCYTYMSHCEWAVCGYEGFFGVGFIVVCRSSSVCNQIKVHTCGCGKVENLPAATDASMDALPANRSWQPSWSHGTYQHEAITSLSRQLLMMGTWLPETFWANIRREIKNTKSDI